MARQSNLHEKIIFTSPSFDPVLALQSKELAKRCSKARPFDNLRQYVNGLHYSTSFKSLGWFPEEFGPRHRSDKRTSKRKASVLLDNRDAASKDSSCSEIDEGKSQRTKQVKLSNSSKDSKRDKSVLSSDGSFKSLFQPSSDDTSLCSDQDFHDIKETLHGDKQKSDTKEPSTAEVTKNRLKSLATSDAKSLKRASKVDKISRFQNVMIEKIEEQNTTTKGRSHENVLQKMEVYQNGPLSVLYNCMNKGIRVKVWTRRYKGLRGVCTGYLIAFDKHMNLAMIDVDEVYTLEIRTLSQVEQEEIAKKKRAEKRNRNRLNRIKRNCEFIEKHENAAEEKIFRGSIGSTNQQNSEPSNQQHVLTAKTESYSLGIVPNKTQLIVKGKGVSKEARSFLKRKDQLDVEARKTASVGKKVEDYNVMPEKTPLTLLHDKQTKINATKIDSNDRKTFDNLKSEFSRSLTVDDALTTKLITTEDSDNLATLSSSCKSEFKERERQVEVKAKTELERCELDFDISESSEDEAENDDIAKRRISDSDGENKEEGTAGSLSGVYALKVVPKSQNVEKISISDSVGKSVASNIKDLKENNIPERKFIEQEPKRRIRCHFSLFSSLANPPKEKNDRHDLSPCSGPRFAKNPEDLTLERKMNVHNDEMIQTSSTVVDVENNTSTQTVSDVLEIISDKETKPGESVVAPKPKPAVNCHEDPNVRRKSVNAEDRSEGGSSYKTEALKQSLVSELEENIKDAPSRDTKSSSGSLSCSDKDSLNKRKQSDVTSNASEVVCKEAFLHKTDEVKNIKNFHLVKLELTPRIAYSDMERCKFSSTEESDAILDASRDPRLQKMKDPKKKQTDQTEHNKIDFKLQADSIIADHDRSSDKGNENIQMHYSLSDSKDKQTLPDLASETDKQKQKQLDPRLRIGKAWLSYSNTSSTTQKQVERDILSPTEECDKPIFFSSSAAANITSNLPDEKLSAIGDIAEKGQEQETKSKMGLPSFSLCSSQKPKQTDPRLRHRRRHSSYLPQRTQESNNCGVLSSSGVSDDNDSPFHTSADSDEGVTAQRVHSIAERSHSGGFKRDEATNINSTAEVSGSKCAIASTDKADQFDAKLTLADIKLDCREINKTKRRTTPEGHNPACYSEETEPSSFSERKSSISARETNSTDDLQGLLSKNSTEMAKQSLAREGNKKNGQNNSENPPYESTSKSALTRFFQKRRPVLDNKKPHADKSIVLQNKPGFAKTSLLEAKETIFRRGCSDANHRTLPTISAVFDPQKPVAGHIFKERHINQIFIRGDNVAMVAYDKT